MKRLVFVSLLSAMFAGNAFAELVTKSYVDNGLGYKQDALVSSDSVTVSGQKLDVVDASATRAGISKLGTIPSGGETSTTTATIWVE